MVKFDSSAFEATWRAAIDNLVGEEECTRVGQPCTIHPGHFAAQNASGAKAARASACDAKDNVHRRFQQNFQDELGLR